jgi:hypothetical protein
MQRNHVLAGLAAVAAIALVSTAIAATSDGGPGAGRSAKAKRGRPGPPGPVGPKGLPGETGATGPSSAREATALTSVQFALTNAAFAGSQPFSAINNLAPGAYAVTAKFALADAGVDAGNVACEIFTGTPAEDDASLVRAVIGTGPGQSAYTTQTTTMTRTFASTGSVDVRCRENATGLDAVISDVNLVAIKLGSESNP